MAKTSRKSNGAATARRVSRITESTQRNGNGEHIAAASKSAARMPVLKTYKIYIGGKFPRTESGRHYLLKNATGEPIANICLSSRQDSPETVVAARSAQSCRAKRSGHKRPQLLYRTAQMLQRTAV